ncbi:MAG: hypothetical protein WDN72_03630 [Alphaproteobacteria bacterium]
MSLKYMPGATAEQKAVMKLNRAGSLGADGKFLWMQPEEGKIAMAMGNTFGYVLIVSATMATLFFITSHIIAAFRDKARTSARSASRRSSGARKRASSSGWRRSSRNARSLPPPRRTSAPDAKVAQVENHLTVRPLRSGAGGAAWLS